MSRPKKPSGTRVKDQLHVGVYFPSPMADVMPKLVAAANMELRRRGLPPRVSLSNLVAHWIAERAAVEEKKELGTSTMFEWLGGPVPESHAEVGTPDAAPTLTVGGEQLNEVEQPVADKRRKGMADHMKETVEGTGGRWRRPEKGAGERQRRAVSSNSLVVEGDLRGALSVFEAPVAFIDFETVSPAIPRWHGCRPYGAVPVQFSVHVEDGAEVSHHEWLAAGPNDPRRPLALALLEACRGARTLVAYNAPFERAGIESLAAVCPDLAPYLQALTERLVDLLPMVREHVYHPAFGGRFGLKAVLPALVGEGYEDLAIADGGIASVTLSQLLFGPVTDGERDALRRALLAYCGRDTWALVRLLRRLRELV